MLRWLQKTGQPANLMGGGTTKVGDPSGQKKGSLGATQIENNISGIKEFFQPI